MWATCFTRAARSAIPDVPRQYAAAWAVQWIRVRLKTSTAKTEEGPPDDELLPTIALVGRPNVGKSALFNRLVRPRSALVYDTPGSHVTRDYKVSVGRLSDLWFKVVDTSGLEPFMAVNTIQGRATALTQRMLQRADITLMLLDAKDGVMPADIELARWLRKTVQNQPLLLVANKAENQKARQGMCQTVTDAYSMGLGELVAISATTGEGMVDLYTALQPLVDTHIHKAQLEQQQQQLQDAQSFKRQQNMLQGTQPTHSLPNMLQGTQPTHSLPNMLQGTQPTHSLPNQPSQTNPDVLSATSESAEFQDVHSLEETSGMSDIGEGGAAHEPAGSIDTVAIESAHQAGRLAGRTHLEGVVGEEVLEKDVSSFRLIAGKVPPGGAAGEAAQEKEVSSPDSFAAESSWPVAQAETAVDGDEEWDKQPVRVAIMGLPNVGKSSLMNALLQDERVITGPEPGLTRDAISVRWNYNGQEVELIDTAGWMKQTHTERYDDVRGVVAEMTIQEGKRALSRAHLVVLVVDAHRAHQEGQVLFKSELGLASDVIKEGRALIIAANKMDLLTPQERDTMSRGLPDALHKHFLEAGRVPVIPMSILKSKGLDNLMPTVLDTYGRWNKRIPTAQLNKFIVSLKAQYEGTGGARGLSRIKFLTQICSRPPTFIVWLSGTEELPEESVRFLAGRIREVMDVQGVPMRLYLRYKQSRKLTASNANVGQDRKAKKRQKL